ncbi:MAG TPA: methanogen output domain 1-containing protein [Acidimicrobiia bacterium]|nr:methanogen output domain 1-containing protein [Acidimicrobiia bacterium]
MDWYLDASAPRAVQRLRHEVDGYLRRHATDVEDVPAALVVVDELVSNAVRHASGPVWVSLEWRTEHPEVTVQDLGDDFDLPTSLPSPDAESGRGLFFVAHLGDNLQKAAKAAGGKRVSARLRVSRPVEATLDPPRSRSDSLPTLDEALPEGGFGRESFLRALVVQLAQAVESSHGPQAAEATVAQVGTDVGGRMEEEFRAATGIDDELTPEEIAECLVRLKRGIGGDFYVIEANDQCIVLGNRHCPFGDVVQRAPALCRMTSSVFGGIAARNTGGATVVLEERIAVGDPECRVVVYLGETPVEVRSTGHRYARPVA